jgi:maltose O-acetyltransferase
VSLRGTERGARIRCYGRLEVERGGNIRIGQRVTFLAGLVPTSLRCKPGAELVVGERTICNYGAALIAKRSVRIGRDCMIASYVHICDDDGRRSGPVVIGDGVWIAHGAVIEPETVIGEGSVISARAVVSGVVPPKTLVAGNPAHFVAMHPSSGRPISGERPSMERLSTERLSAERLSADRLSADRLSVEGLSVERPAVDRSSMDGQFVGGRFVGGRFVAGPIVELPLVAGPLVAEPSVGGIAGDGAPTLAEVRQAVIDWLDDTRCFGEAAEQVSDNTMSLREAGLLDSLGLVQLVAALERRFDTAIDRQRVAMPEAQSIHGLLQCMIFDKGDGSDR